MTRVLTCVTQAPAAIIGLAPPTLAPGAQADLVVIDPEMSWQLDDTTRISRAHNNPYDKHPLKGRVRATLIDGQPISTIDQHDTDQHITH